MGFVLACATMNTGARYFAMCTFATGVYACNSVILGWVSSTCGQTKEKKAISLAIVNTVAAISPIYTPVNHACILCTTFGADLFKYLWPSSDSPRYTTAMASSAAFSLVAALLAWVMRRMLVKENRKIRQSDSETVLFYAY